MTGRIKRIVWNCRWRINHSLVAREFRRRNTKKSCSIISANCIGGLLYHDLRLRFDSPTINCWFEAADFVEFCENLHYYLNCELQNVAIDDKLGYPVGYLDNDIKIYFQHYHSVEEVCQKWKIRSKRVDYDNLYVICAERDGMTRELLERVLRLPYRKIAYVGHKSMVLNESCIYVPGFEQDAQLPPLTNGVDLKGYRYYDKYFDIVAWLNTAE